ncbi:SlyX family protein [Vitreoscilla massiliensis]|uniref:Protein SlyX homolog n=1 Tax=Vitreoscilla massiliensis TaxID=1689272 RepID=A0ABY4E3F2_9NEIS|nr:SlyX family protein [Vitreoscilla massiliensis]UOO87942.1 SlyX family protein [Vitreoscilla massiliensis]
MQDMDTRITELEIRLALQDDTIDVLNKQISELYEQLASQQKQLQLLYRKFSEAADNQMSTSGNEPPPHY